MLLNINYEILKNNKYEEQILAWRNDNLTRKNSINQEIISEIDHTRWLSEQLINKNTLLIMFLFNSKPAGLVKLDALGNDEYGISINLNPKYRGMKLSSIFIKQSIHYLIENQDKNKLRILASIKSDNLPSIKAFERAGFNLSNSKYRENLFLFSKDVINTKDILFLGYSEEDTGLINRLTKRGFKVANFQNKLDSNLFLDYDLVISYGYRFILTKDQLSNCKQPPINLHISLLPWNRGAHPNFWAFHDSTPHGVTIHEIDEGIDTGRILFQKELIFDENLSLKSSYNQKREEIENLFISNLFDIIYRTTKPFKSDSKGTFHLSKELPNNINWELNINQYFQLGENND